MQRIKGLVLSALLAACVATGALAATRTVRLGQAVAAPATVPAHALAARRAKLDAFARSLHAALARRPPALPAVPHYAPVPIPQAPPPAPAPRVVAAAPAPAAPAAQAPPVRVVQPPPVVRYVQAPPTQAAPQGEPSEDGGGWGDDGPEGGDD